MKYKDYFIIERDKTAKEHFTKFPKPAIESYDEDAFKMV